MNVRPAPTLRPISNFWGKIIKGHLENLQKIFGAMSAAIFCNAGNGCQSDTDRFLPKEFNAIKTLTQR